MLSKNSNSGETKMKNDNRGPSPVPVSGQTDYHKKASSNRTKSMPPQNPAPKSVPPSSVYKGSPRK